VALFIFSSFLPEELDKGLVGLLKHSGPPRQAGIFKGNKN